MSFIKAEISSVIIGDRVRKQVEVSDLVSSIKDVGLIHPIVIDEQNRLICGFRRLQAAKELGWSEIPVTVSACSADTLQALKMERDENDNREPFTPSESVAMAKLIEDQVKREAKERQLRTKENREKSCSGEISGTKNRTEQNRAESESRRIIADAVGMSDFTLRQAKSVLKNGNDEVIEAMDQGKISINKAFHIAKLPADEQSDALAGKKQPAQKKEKPKKLKVSEDHFNQPDSPFSAQTIRFRIIHALNGFRLTDPNAREQLLIIKTRIDEMLNQLENAS